MSSFFVGGVRPWPQELRRRPNDLFQNTLTRPTRNAAGQVGVQMGMYAPQRPPAAGVRPRPSPSPPPRHSSGQTPFGQTGALTDGRTERGPRFSAACVGRGNAICPQLAQSGGHCAQSATISRTLAQRGDAVCGKGGLGEVPEGRGGPKPPILRSKHCRWRL